MPKIKYADIRFAAEHAQIITLANSIIAEYERKGFELTLRQLYYQFVARDLLANKDTEYKRLGDIINRGRMAGLVDWHAINDRTRYLRTWGGDNDPANFLEQAAEGFDRDHMEGQTGYVEVWVEKDALVGVVERACAAYRTPFFSCRGYASASELWRAAQRLGGHARAGRDVHVIHLGDHDPSGIDMTRDITERLELLSGGYDIPVERIALNMDQIEEYGPPPNPAKITDSRAQGYISVYGSESWELDALDPTDMVNLIRSKIEPHIDLVQMERIKAQSRRERDALVEYAAAFEMEGDVDFSGQDED